MDGPPPARTPTITKKGANDTVRALDELIASALAYRSGPEFKALCDFIRRFPTFAPFNAMLLHVQNPNIRFAARAPVWTSKYRRRVTKGARPYVTLQTMGPVAFVYDVSNTELIDPNDDPIADLANDGFRA